MTEPAVPPVPTTPPAEEGQPVEGAREPDASPQRALVDSISAYEIDPPPPPRVEDAEPEA